MQKRKSNFHRKSPEISIFQQFLMCQKNFSCGGLRGGGAVAEVSHRKTTWKSHMAAAAAAWSCVSVGWCMFVEAAKEKVAESLQITMRDMLQDRNSLSLSRSPSADIFFGFIFCVHTHAAHSRHRIRMFTSVFSCAHSHTVESLNEMCGTNKTINISSSIRHERSLLASREI